MSTKHTPGPWSMKHREVTAATGEVYQHFEIGEGWKDGRYLSVSGCIDEADARLIAAAPDQHEANKTSLCVLCALLDANDWHPNMRKDIEFAIAMNRAAIAKATEA